MKYIRSIVLLFFVFIASGLMFSCSEHSLQLLEISLPKLTEEYLVVDSWYVFYIDGDQITRILVDASNRVISIRTKKTGNIPVLACGKFSGIELMAKSYSSQNFSFVPCSLSAGAIYPFDTSTQSIGFKHTISLEYFNKAQVAQLLLSMYGNGANIDKLNVAKLYSAIESKSPNDPIDIEKFYEYLKKNSLSTWGIKPMTMHEVGVPSSTHTWYSASKWIPHIAPETNIVMLYSGKWLFFYEEKQLAHKESQASRIRYVWIRVTKDGIYNISEF